MRCATSRPHTGVDFRVSVVAIEAVAIMMLWLRTEGAEVGARGSYCGLRTMVERRKAMGAQLQIWSDPESGAEVELSFLFDPGVSG